MTSLQECLVFWISWPITIYSYCFVCLYHNHFYLDLGRLYHAIAVARRLPHPLNYPSKLTAIASLSRHVAEGSAPVEEVFGQNYTCCDGVVAVLLTTCLWVSCRAYPEYRLSVLWNNGDKFTTISLARGRQAR